MHMLTYAIHYGYARGFKHIFPFLSRIPHPGNRTWVLSIMITLPPLVGWRDRPSFVLVNETQMAQCVLFQTPGKSTRFLTSVFAALHLFIYGAAGVK